MEKKYQINHDFITPYASYRKGDVNDFKEWSKKLEVDYGTIQAWIDNTDWFSEVKPERIKVVSASPSSGGNIIYKNSNEDFTKEEITAIENLLNGEIFTRGDMKSFAQFYQGRENFQTGVTQDLVDWKKSKSSDINR